MTPTEEQRVEEIYREILTRAPEHKVQPSLDRVRAVVDLMASPERLIALRAQCKADHDKIGDALCNTAAEATRRRFMGSGTPYTPESPAATASPRKD